MKKTLTINLNSIVFNIDDDAYEALKKYLSDVSAHFSSEGERVEIMNDIEARIAELFSEKISHNKNVITIEDVNEIIVIMGSPSQYSDAEETTEESQSTKSEKKKRARRFYRDPENAMLGGIAAGLAAYFGIDVTLVRIILVLLIVVGVGFLIPVYLIVWIITPEAVSPSQRLEMQGEDVTIENIKSEFNNAKSYVQSDDFKKSAHNVGNTLAKTFTTIIKIFLGFIGGILGFVGIILLIVLFALLMVAIFTPAIFFSFIPEFMTGWAFLTPESPILLTVAMILIVGCPVFMTVYWIIHFASGRRSNSKTAFWVTLVLWLTGIFMFISFGARTAVQFKKQNEEWVVNWGSGNVIDEQRAISPFSSIDIAGNFKLLLKDGFDGNVGLKGDDDFLPAIISEVKNETLFIYSNGVSFNKPIEISLGMGELTDITARGASEIETKDTVRAQNLSLHLLGASKADLDVVVQSKLDVTLKGASHIEMDGNCGKLGIRADGVSNIKTKELTARSVDIKIAGMSTADVYASDSLNAKADGFSKINCFGSPEHHSTSSGFGSHISIR